MSDTLTELTRLLAEKLHIEVPSAQTDLIDTGLLDSLRLVELLLHIEAELGWRIRLDDIDLDDLRSVERIARLIGPHRQQAEPSLA